MYYKEASEQRGCETERVLNFSANFGVINNEQVIKGRKKDKERKKRKKERKKGN